MTFETELTTRRKTLLYLYQACPLINIIDKIYNIKKEIEHRECMQWYIDIFPFKNNKNNTYMRWFIKEFNIYSKLSQKDINYLEHNHRTIFMNLSSMYAKDKSCALVLSDTPVSYNCI